MALTEQRKRELDAMMNAPKPAAPVSGGVLTPERKAQLDAIMNKTTETPQPTGFLSGLTSGISNVVKGVESVNTGIGSFVGEGLKGLGRAVLPKSLESTFGVDQKPLTAQQQQGRKDFGDVITGAGKGVTSTIKGMSSLVDKGMSAIHRAILPKSWEKALGIRQVGEKTSAEALQEQIEQYYKMDKGSLTTPVNNMQKAGFTAEQIAEFFIPGGASTKVGKAAEATVEGGRLLKGLAKVSAMGATEAGITTGQYAMQKGELGKEELKGGLFAGVGLPVISGVLGKAGRMMTKDKKVVDELVLKMTQGTKDEVNAAKEALKQVDLKNVKSFEDLYSKLADAERKHAIAVDQVLKSDTRRFAISQLGRKTTAGQHTVEQNFVDDAMKQLEELYQKTGDAQELVKMKHARDLIDKNGLTVKDINDLARKYNIEFGEKAFSKISGDPLTSVNAVKFENTRKGIKTTARDLFGGELPKQLDETTSSIIRTKQLADKMVEKVNNLRNKVKPFGSIEKGARFLGDIFNIGTFGGPKAFISKLLPSNVGLKTMNSLDIEKYLLKNVGKLDKYLNMSKPELEKLFKAKNFEGGAQGLINLMKTGQKTERK